MFNNLIESSSHAREFKRRGSFLLFTTAVYAVLILLSGVASIYAYDAQLEAQNTELDLLTFVPVDLPEVDREVVRNTIRPASNSDNPPGRSTRTERIDSASNPTNVPDIVGTKASSVPDARPDSVIGPNQDPLTPAVAGNRVGPGPGEKANTPVVNIPDTPPAPDPPRPKPPVLKISRVLNSEAVELPVPAYPPLARQIRLKGTVNVQVLIDESGRVISAKAVNGHPLLVPAAQQAAMRARFSPTRVNDQAVKIQGVITYNFVMN